MCHTMEEMQDDLRWALSADWAGDVNDIRGRYLRKVRDVNAAVINTPPDWDEIRRECTHCSG
jgi:hypothetical protein